MSDPRGGEFRLATMRIIAMDAQDKRRAEAVLRHLCVGAQIDGVRFGIGFVILLDHLNDKHPVSYDNIYLNVESRWNVFQELPQDLPAKEQDLPDLPLGQRLCLLANLQGQRVVDAALAHTNPHLILTFESGKIFFLNGYHEEYECWQLGLTGARDDQNWLIVALP